MNKGNPSFDEEYVSPHRDPLSPRHVEFDFAAVERAFGELETEADREAVARFVRALFNWVTDISIDHPNAQAMAGRRFLALAWVLDPALFDGISAAGLAARLGIKSINKFQRLTGEVTRRFKITNRAQRVSDHNRKGLNHADHNRKGENHADG
jgi:hypothetical protein